MSIYKLVNGKGGKRYMKDGRLTSESKVPEDIIEKLKMDPVYDDSYVEPSKSCIFCGQHSKWSRFINLRTIPICETHYYTETTGKIVQRLKELESGKEEKEDDKKDAHETNDEGQDAQNERVLDAL